MKLLGLHEIKEDGLQLLFEGASASSLALEQELFPFFDALSRYSTGWTPEVVEGKRRRKYTHTAVWKALEERREDRLTHCGFYRTTWPALDMSLSLNLPPLAPELNVLLEVKPLALFAEADRCHHFVELVRAWASSYPITHVTAHSVADAALAGAPDYGRDMQVFIRDGFDKIYEVSWLNVFGPKLVEAVGRERMLSTPAWRVEELPHGAVLLVIWPTAADFSSDEARRAQALAHCHLRPDLDFDTVFERLRERSAALAPVLPDFPPDVTALCSRVVEGSVFHQRQRKIAELNAWRPPEPDEWFPAGAALPCDVADPARAREHYDFLAEHLVALLHTKVPSVFQATPESLTDVDYQLWHEEYPRVFERELLDARAVPALGAYLGEVLVRHLGGQWIARQKLEEAQVLVGQRVWFPFLRAQHALRSVQSLLDFSLTQLYRVAARHR